MSNIPEAGLVAGESMPVGITEGPVRISSPAPRIINGGVVIVDDDLLSQ